MLNRAHGGACHEPNSSAVGDLPTSGLRRRMSRLGALHAAHRRVRAPAWAVLAKPTTLAVPTPQPVCDDHARQLHPSSARHPQHNDAPWQLHCFCSYRPASAEPGRDATAPEPRREAEPPLQRVHQTNRLRGVGQARRQESQTSAHGARREEEGGWRESQQITRDASENMCG